MFASHQLLMMIATLAQLHSPELDEQLLRINHPYLVIDLRRLQVLLHQSGHFQNYSYTYNCFIWSKKCEVNNCRKATHLVAPASSSSSLLPSSVILARLVGGESMFDKQLTITEVDWDEVVFEGDIWEASNEFWLQSATINSAGLRFIPVEVVGKSRGRFCETGATKVYLGIKLDREI